MELQMMPHQDTDNSSTNTQPQPPSKPCFSALSSLSPQDIRYMIDHISEDQKNKILLTAALKYPDVLIKIRDAANCDINLRKLFIRGLSPETTSATLHSVFSPFGIVNEAVVIYDKVTKRSKCYGFISFKHVDAAILAMKNPSRRINGRMTVTQPSSVKVFNNTGRKIFVENIPFHISSNELLNHFLKYREVEEGPIAFERNSNRRRRGFAFFVYKTKEAAQAAVCFPVKLINGHMVNCRMAVDHKKLNQAQVTLPIVIAAIASLGFSGDAMSRQML